MENKYYTPELNEFFQGFEYEVLIKENWEKQDLLYSNKYIKVHGFSYLDSLIQNARVRVKYLDKEDIESLGWKLNNNYYCLNNSNGLSYYLWITPNLISINKGVRGSLIQDTKQIFKGIIKNKSELIKLLKQLEIDEN